MKKTVLYIGNFNLPTGSASAQRVNVNKKIIEESGFKVIFISTFQASYELNENSSDINISSVPLIGISHLKNAIKEIGEEYIHSVIFYNYPSVALFRANKMLKKMNIKSFADCTEWFGIPPKGNFLYKITKFLDTEFRMRNVQKQLDGVICISTYLEKYYSKSSRTMLLPNTIDTEDNKWINQGYKNDSNEIKFIYAGNPGKYFEKESLDLIVDVMSSIDSPFLRVTLEIVGVEEEEFKKIYHEKYERNARLNNVIFSGKISHLSTVKRVKNSHYFIFFRPKTKANMAGFPTKLVESFGALTPVISNPVGDIPFYIEDKVNGYIIDNLEIEALKQEINEVIKNHSFQGELRKELINSNPFDYKKYTKVFAEFIN